MPIVPKLFFWTSDADERRWSEQDVSHVPIFGTGQLFFLLPRSHTYVIPTLPSITITSFPPASSYTFHDSAVSTVVWLGAISFYCHVPLISRFLVIIFSLEF
jgi:hypothetical protein